MVVAEEYQVSEGVSERYGHFMLAGEGDIERQ